MKISQVKKLAGIVFLFFITFNTKGQHAYETFGRNRIQYKELNWKYLSSENFDLYFYGDRKKAAQEALQYMESEFDRITDLLGFYPYQKTKVFLYNSVTDLQQSNVGLNYNRYMVSGETEFIKPYVEIAHPGNLEEFKEELVFKMSHLLVNEMMFGGSLRDMFTSGVLLNLPDWFINGTSYYVAHGWNEEMDDYVRQLVVDKKVNKALRLKDHEAALVGQSIWNYIVEKYGKSSINNILNYTRIIRNEERSILLTLGVPFRQLVNDWKEYYLNQEKRVAQSYVPLSPDDKFTRQKRHDVTFTTVKISPDGKSVAYAVNDRGKFSVKVKSLENGVESTIISGGNKAVITQTVDYRVPLLNWSDANTLGVIGVEKGQYIFWLYDLKTKTKLPRELDKFSNIRSFSFSNNGRLVIVSADFEGQNDLFLLSSRRDRTKRLTHDAFDDLDPHFIPNSNTVVFSSNRPTDSLTTDVKALQKLSPYYNLFLYNIDTTTNRLKRITHTLSKDFHARAMDSRNFFYLSDQRGITNLFRYNTETGTYSQVTNFNSSIKDYDVNFDGRLLSVVLSQDLHENIFVQKDFNFDRQVFTPSTKRKEISQARTLIERKKKEPAKISSLKDLINSRIKERTDSVGNKPESKAPAPEAKKDTTAVVTKKPNEISTDDYSFDEEPQKVVPQKEEPKTNVPVVAEKPAVKQETKTISTDDYTFEDDVIKQKQQPNESFLTRYAKAREVNKVQGPFPYAPKFSYDNLAASILWDPLRGLSLRWETQMNDMLENYKICAGLQFSVADIKSGDVFAEFQYLPHRIDLTTRFDRKVIYWQTKVANDNQQASPQENQKYSFQKIEVGASYPFSVRTRFAIKPFIGFTEYVDRGATTPIQVQFMPSKYQFYTGARAELVYDNSTTSGLNVIDGTRGKLAFITYNASGAANKNFSQAYLDVRHYQKVYKEITFAVRVYAGSFFGKAPQKYMLGGIDNWVAPNFNYSGKQNPLVNATNAYNENLLFSEFATDLRGFDYATQFGNNVALANLEFRVPIVRALASGPVSSSFFRNLQFVSFYDIGSSWNGAIPIGNSNEGLLRTVKQPPFTVEIKEYINPWLYSYGAGLRSTIFGYFIKLDLAWPVVNYKILDPRLQFSLGFDF